MIGYIERVGMLLAKRGTLVDYGVKRYRNIRIMFLTFIDGYSYADNKVNVKINRKIYLSDDNWVYKLVDTRYDGKKILDKRISYNHFKFD